MNKQCQVCGDKAIGFNFKGLSCASCKSFFLRNAIRHEELKCQSNGQCRIVQSTRKFCSKCRLDKCVQIGMNRNLIRNKINSYNHKLRRRITPRNSSLVFIDSNIENLLEIKIENNLQFIFDSSSPQKSTFELTQLEQTLIDQVHSNATSVFEEENNLPLVACATDLIYVLNLYESYVRRTIKFCKNIVAFKCLNQEDQLAMLKSFFAELIIIRIVFSFDSDKDAFRLIKDDLRMQSIFVPINVLLHEWRFSHLISFCRKYIKQFSAELDDDPIIRDLVLVLQLFRPQNVEVNCSELIRYEHFKYRRLLQRYLEHKYANLRKAADKFVRIMKLTSEMTKMKSIIDALFVQTEPSQLAHLLNEMFR